MGKPGNDAGATAQFEGDYSVAFGISGAHRLLVRVDSQSSVVEADETNNGWTQLISTLAARPPADLAVDNLSVTGPAATGRPLSVQWTDRKSTRLNSSHT